MSDDVETLQAMSFLRDLHAQVESVSRKLEIVERRERRRSARGIASHHREHSALRRELHEAHRLIDGLHRRYPNIPTCEHISQTAATR